MESKTLVFTVPGVLFLLQSFSISIQQLMVIALGSNALTLARHLIQVHAVESFSVETLIESVGCRRIGKYDEFNTTRLGSQIQFCPDVS